MYGSHVHVKQLTQNRSVMGFEVVCFILNIFYNKTKVVFLTLVKF